MEMTRELFVQMLDGRDELKASGDTYSAPEDAHVDVLIAAASGGPVPVSKVVRLKLGDAFVTLTGKEAEYCLPYGLLVGLKFAVREAERSGRRTGFST